MIKKYYVYKIQFPDLTYYIGYRGTCQVAATDFLVKYFSSSKVVVEKMKTNSFVGTILHENLKKEVAYAIEQELILKHFNDPLCLNKACYYGREGFGILSESAKEKIKVDVINRWKDPAYKDRLSNSHKERWKSNPELRIQQSNRMAGKSRPAHSEKMKQIMSMKEHKQRTSKQFSEMPRTEAHCEHIALALKGKPKTEEHINRLKEILSQRTSKDWQKILENRRLKSKPKFEINGVSYVSLKQASEEFGISPFLVKKLITHHF